MRLKSILVCVLAAPLLIAAAEPVRLQPTSPWDVDYGEDSCRLIRTFGDGEKLTTLTFESEGPGRMDMLVVGKPLSTWDQQAPAEFLPSGSKIGEGQVAKTANRREPAVLWSSVDMLPEATLARLKAKVESIIREHPGVRGPIRVAAENGTDLAKERRQFATAAMAIEVDTNRNHPVVLETGSLGEPMAALEKCNNDSLRDWGIDPDVQAKIVQPPWPLNPGGWIRGDDYPRGMLNLGEESEVTIRALIDATGKITKCSSFSHYKAPEFNQISCAKFTERARFEPAKLADGTKVPSFFMQRIQFRIAQ